MVLHPVKTIRFWRSVFAELYLSWIFLFCGCAVSLNPPSWLTPISIGLTVGLGIATFAYCGWEVSGGIMNPAITVTFIITRRVYWLEGIFHILSQSLGGILAAATLHGVTPPLKRNELGLLRLQGDVTPGQGLAVEIMMTMILLFTIFAVTDGGRGLTGYQPAVAIGLSLVLTMIVSVQYTGGCLNPARQFGPAVITNTWDDHWVYWVGPIVGGIIGGLMYDLVFSTPEGRCLLKHQTPPESTTNKYVITTANGNQDVELINTIVR